MIEKIDNFLKNPKTTLFLGILITIQGFVVSIWFWATPVTLLGGILVGLGLFGIDLYYKTKRHIILVTT